MNAEAVTQSIVGSVIGAVLTFGGLVLSKRTDWQKAKMDEKENYYKRLHEDLDAAREELDSIRQERVEMQEERMKELHNYAAQIFNLQHDKAQLYLKIEKLVERVKALEARVRACESCPVEIPAVVSGDRG